MWSFPLSQTLFYKLVIQIDFVSIVVDILPNEKLISYDPLAIYVENRFNFNYKSKMS
jgi:hypothetical protein